MRDLILSQINKKMDRDWIFKRSQWLPQLGRESKTLTRRWMIAPETLGEYVRVMDVKGFLKSGANIRKYRFDPDSYDYEYNVNELSPGIENRQWLDKIVF